MTHVEDSKVGAAYIHACSPCIMTRRFSDRGLHERELTDMQESVVSIRLMPFLLFTYPVTKSLQALSRGFGEKKLSSEEDSVVYQEKISRLSEAYKR